jgi:protein TonB
MPLVKAMLAAGCWLLAAGAAAPPPDGVQTRRQESPVTLKPTWLGKPTLDDYARYYPGRAAAEGFEGRAMLDCRVSPERAFGNCFVLDSDPPRPR